MSRDMSRDTTSGAWNEYRAAIVAALKRGIPFAVAAKVVQRAAGVTVMDTAEAWNEAKEGIAKEEGVSTWDAHDIMVGRGYLLVPEVETATDETQELSLAALNERLEGMVSTGLRPEDAYWTLYTEGFRWEIISPDDPRVQLDGDLYEHDVMLAFSVQRLAKVAQE